MVQSGSTRLRCPSSLNTFPACSFTFPACSFPARRGGYGQGTQGQRKPYITRRNLNATADRDRPGVHVTIVDVRAFPAGIGRSAAGELGHASIEARRLAQGSPLVSQKWAGSNSPGASGGSASFSRKHELWHVHTCHLPAAVSTVTRQGSALVFSMSRPQKQHGPNLTSIVPPSTRPPLCERFYKLQNARLNEIFVYCAYWMLDRERSALPWAELRAIFIGWYPCGTQTGFVGTSGRLKM